MLDTNGTKKGLTQNPPKRGNTGPQNNARGLTSRCEDASSLQTLASLIKNTTSFSHFNRAFVPSANVLNRECSEASYVDYLLTMTMQPERFVVCCAVNATWLSGCSVMMSKYSGLRLNI